MEGFTRGTGLPFGLARRGKARNAFCGGEAVKRDDLTDIIAAAVDRIPRVRRGVIGLYLLAILIVIGFIVLLSLGGWVAVEASPAAARGEGLLRRVFEAG